MTRSVFNVQSMLPMNKKLSFCLLSLLFSISLLAQNQVEATVEKYKDLSDQLVIFDMAIDGNNAKWLATDQGLTKIASIRTKPEKMMTDQVFKALAVASDGSVWSANDQNEILNGNMEVVGKLGDNSMKVICMTFYRGLLYIGTNQGLITFNTKLSKQGKTYLSNKTKLPNDTINMVLADSRDQLWVGTNAGLVKFKKGKIKEVFEKKHQFWAATETKEGIWVVSDKEMWLLDFLESNRWERWRPAALRRGLSRGQVRGLTSDSKGRLYLASETLVQFNPYDDQVTQIDKNYGFVSSDALALACDRNDDLWVGTGDEGLFRIDILEGETEELSAVAYVDQEIPCHGESNGIIKLKINGGKSPYTIIWNTSSGSLGLTELTNVEAGTYTATITDADRNEYIASTQLDQPEPILITEVSNQNISVLNARDGAIEAAVSGGTEPYNLRWSNGKRNVNSVQNLPYGECSLTVIDDNRCQVKETFFVGKPKVLPQLNVAEIEVGQTLRIEQLYFTADSAEVITESYPVLDEIFDFLHENPNIVVEIGGHTNGIPSHEYCDRLSSARAENVAEYLYKKGIGQEQIIHKGYGKRQPIATNKSKQGRQKNQRVELKIVEIKGG